MTLSIDEACVPRRSTDNETSGLANSAGLDLSINAEAIKATGDASKWFMTAFALGPVSKTASGEPVEDISVS